MKPSINYDEFKGFNIFKRVKRATIDNTNRVEILYDDCTFSFYAKTFEDALYILYKTIIKIENNKL